MHMMCSRTNFSACLPFVVVRGLASTYLVECSTTIAKNFIFPGAVGRGLKILIPYLGSFLPHPCTLMEIVALFRNFNYHRARPVSNASYSALLFVVSNLNRRAYVYSFPPGLISINPAPEPSELGAPLGKGLLNGFVGQYSDEVSLEISSKPPCSVNEG
ncbi:hypothetical protein Tco_0051293 [Tanacetum coccineum]